MTFITDDEIKKVVQALKTQIDLADLDKTAVITEVPLSALTDAVLLINDLTAKIKSQQAENQKLRLSLEQKNDKIEGLSLLITKKVKQIAQMNSKIIGLEMYGKKKNVGLLSKLIATTKVDAFKEFVARIEMLLECNHNDDHCISVQQIKKHIHETAEILEGECNDTL